MDIDHFNQVTFSAFRDELQKIASSGALSEELLKIAKALMNPGAFARVAESARESGGTLAQKAEQALARAKLRSAPVPTEIGMKSLVGGMSPVGQVGTNPVVSMIHPVARKTPAAGIRLPATAYSV